MTIPKSKVAKLPGLMHANEKLRVEAAKNKATIAECRRQIKHLKKKVSELLAKEAARWEAPAGKRDPRNRVVHVEKDSPLDKKARDKICNDPELKAYGKKLVSEKPEPKRAAPVCEPPTQAKILAAELARVNQDLDRYPDDEYSLERRGDIVQLLEGEPQNQRQELLLDRLCVVQATNKKMQKLRNEVCELSRKIATTITADPNDPGQVDEFHRQRNAVDEFCKQRDALKAQLEEMGKAF
jgi:hypothetical protein